MSRVVFAGACSAFVGAMCALLNVRASAIVLSCILVLDCEPGIAEPSDATPKGPSSVSSPPAPQMTLDGYLDRLMIAESGGRLYARNARSTAYGPYQFINATFLAVVRKHFSSETSQLTTSQILALRADRAFARRAAAAYTNDNAVHLASHGIKPSFTHLRLAFLVGPTGAVRVLRTPPDTPVSAVLSPAAIRANRFMSAMTVRDLVAKCARDLAVTPNSAAGLTPRLATGKAKSQLGIIVRCSLKRASCRRWLALAKRRLRLKRARQAQRQQAQRQQAQRQQAQRQQAQRQKASLR